LTTVFIDTIELPAAGTYTAMVDPSGPSTGTVTVRVTTITDATGSVTINGGAVPVTIATAGQRALITFSGTAGQQATVRITNSTTGYTTVTLKKPDGSTATSSSTSGSNFNLATQTLVEGQYTIIVDPSGTGTGTLNVAVTSP
jgi:ABC-type cobalamin transport system ATPase subunit